MSDAAPSETVDPFVADIQPPEPLGPAAYEALEAVILHNVTAGAEDPLLDLSNQTEVDLVALAYYDLMRLDRLERTIKTAMIKGNAGEPAARRFNLATFRRAAVQTRRLVNESRAQVQKLRQRNASILAAGGTPNLGSEVDIPGGSPLSLQAMVEANSSFLRAAGLLLMFRGGRVWYDEFYGDYMTDWDGTADDRVILVRRVGDAFLLSVHGYLLMLDTKLGTSSTRNTEACIHFVGDKDVRNEPRDWLRGLKWDGVARLATLMPTAYGTPDDLYHGAVGRCWFVSMAARMMVPGCKVDTMPVLYGPQGTFKSTSLEVIGGAWYAVLNTSAAKSEDFRMSLLGLIVGEIAELDAISGQRVENSRVKTLLSTSEDLFRPPYGRTAKKFLRTVVFVGTTNDPSWHRDETGGRRFWPVHCPNFIDLEWLKANRVQLFAEAHARYARGESWSDVPRDEQERRVMEHHTADPWVDVIGAAVASWELYTGPGSKVEAIAGDPEAVEERAHWGTVLTTNRIALQALGIAKERQTKATSNRIGQAMRYTGWTQKTVRVQIGRGTKPTRGWVVTQDEDQNTTPIGELSLRNNDVDRVTD